MPIRLRLTLTYVGLLTAALGVVLGVSWWLLAGHLRRTVPDDVADAALAALAGQYGLAVAGAALGVLGVGWLVAGHALAPLRTIAATARRITDERLDARVRLEGPEDELHDLAGAFDAMLDRVAASVDAQRRFVANASHELRTPLTAIRAEAEVALDDPDASVEELRAMARSVVAATERTEHLLSGLLALAGAGAGRDQPVRLDDAVRRACARVPGVRVRCEDAVVRGDPALLERVVATLVDNAVRHGRGPVEVALRRDGAWAELRVANGGERIADEDLARIVEPFERLGRSRAAGTGLGLSIVRAVAEAHGGSLALRAPDRGGLDARVRLRLAAEPTAPRRVPEAAARRVPAVTGR